MIRALLAAAALAATVPGPNPADVAAHERGGAHHPAVSSADTEALRALQLLAAEDVEGARAVAEPLLAAHPDHRGAKLAAGVLRLYQQRYDEAVRLMEEAAKKGGQGGGQGFPFPFAESGGEQGGEGEGLEASREKVKIPGAEAHRVPEEFRRDLLEAMKQGVPERYRGDVQRYYEELVK